METITSKEYKQILSECGFSYLGATKTNPKVAKNSVVGNVLTYSISLLQGNLSGHEVCAPAKDSPCRDLCLGFSGHSKASILAYGVEGSPVVKARAKKTQLFFKDRDKFMSLLIYELEQSKRYAEKRGMPFAVRLNCMSDLSPLAFHFSGDSKCLLEMYPDVQFYDYTKAFNRKALCERFSNYQLTFSYDGKNWNDCVDALESGYNVAVVFDSPVMPVAWRGYSVITGIETDIRFLDPQGGFIVYLMFHRSANQYKGGKYQKPNTPFVVMEDDPEITYAFKFGKDNEE
jgi:hypothetical protein